MNYVSLDEDSGRGAALKGAFEFPNPVNDYAARCTAALVVVLAVVTIVSPQPVATWLAAVMAVGFALRVAGGPRYSPFGRLSVHVIAPKLGPAKLVPVETSPVEIDSEADFAFAEMREVVLRQRRADVFQSHGDTPWSPVRGESRRLSYSGTEMLIFFTIRTGSGRTRSTESRPLRSSAPRTFMPSARTNVRWNWRAAMPRCR